MWLIHLKKTSFFWVKYPAFQRQSKEDATERRDRDRRDDGRKDRGCCVRARRLPASFCEDLDFIRIIMNSRVLAEIFLAP